MLSPEDLRGREFRWQVTGESPEILVFEEGAEATRLVPSPKASRAYYAAVGQERIRIEHVAGPVGPTFRITDPGRSLSIAASSYAPDLSLTAVFEDRRTYSLRRAPHSTSWQDETGDVVTFRPGGTAYVLMGAHLTDAPVLLLLGMVMAVEHTLFPA